MESRVLSVAAVLGLGAVFLPACEAPSEPEAGVEVASVFAAAVAGSPVANGSGVVTFDDEGARAFAFTANRMPDGSARGQIEVAIGVQRGHVHARVTCAEADGNRAFIGGEVTASNVWGEGWKVGVVVEDNGTAGRPTPDRITLLNNRQAIEEVREIFDQLVCDQEFDLSARLFEVRKGNINVFD